MRNVLVFLILPNQEQSLGATYSEADFKKAFPSLHSALVEKSIITRSTHVNDCLVKIAFQFQTVITSVLS